MTFRVSQLSKNQLGHLLRAEYEAWTRQEVGVGDFILPQSKGLLRALISAGHVRTYRISPWCQPVVLVLGTSYRPVRLEPGP